MWNPFIWLSGADTTVIELCQKQKRYEQIKFSGIGALVIAPAVVGFFSMSYAISTVVQQPWEYYGGGVVWGLIVLAIDRLLVSTTTKSDVKPPGILAVIGRYVLALFLGVAVAHPFVLRWFDASIQQRLLQNKDIAIAQRRLDGEQEKKNLSETPRPFAKRIEEKTKLLECKRALLTNEQSGIDSRLDCGSTAEKSGPECGPRCANIQGQITDLEHEIAALEKQAADTGETTERSEAIKKIDTATKQDIDRIDKRFATDYLARVDALAEIQKGDPEKKQPAKPHIWWVGWFMILFFMIVDIVPITLKLAIPMGEYEMIRDTQLVEIDLRQLAERAAFQAHASTVYQSTAQAKLNNVAYMDNISHVTEMTREFIRRQEQGRIEFNRRLEDIRKSVAALKDDERRQVYIDYMNEIKRIFDASWTKALTMFREFIQGVK
ncbi:MAG: hypothetical protein JWM21_3603 [Acidobacteria bacterium]|nr:hypothetical protein [Acidobacteriota bacterium]